VKKGQNETDENGEQRIFEVSDEEKESKGDAKEEPSVDDNKSPATNEASATNEEVPSANEK